jgi:hypothetical protein
MAHEVEIMWMMMMMLFFPRIMPVERGILEISSPWLHLKWELNLRMPPLRGHIPYT